MDTHCSWCNIRFGTHEERVVINDKSYHRYCRRRVAITYTQEGASHEVAVQRVQCASDRRDFSPRLGAG